MDEATERYVAWREECAAVRGGYEYWSRGSGADRTIWFAAYDAALDREECAAELWALSVDVRASRSPSFDCSYES